MLRECSCFMCHVSRVICHVSSVTCPVSPVTGCLSPVTCHLSKYFFLHKKKCSLKTGVLTVSPVQQQAPNNHKLNVYRFF